MGSPRQSKRRLNVENYDMVECCMSVDVKSAQRPTIYYAEMITAMRGNPIVLIPDIRMPNLKGLSNA